MAVDRAENRHGSVAGIRHARGFRHRARPQDVVPFENVLSHGMEPFGSDSHSRKQLVADSQVITERMRALERRIWIGQRHGAKILRYICEIDFATWGAIHATKLTLGDTVSVQVRPGGASLDRGHVRRIIDPSICGGSGRFEPVKTEADGGFSVAEQVIHNGRARRECPPNRQVNIAKRRNTGEAPTLCGLP